MQEAPEQEATQHPARRRWGRTWWLAIGALWAGSIFLTSCYVIRPHEFFALVQYWGLVDASSMEAFQIFWGIWWFTIVKGWHFTEFALLTLFAAWALQALWPKLGQWGILLAMLMCFAYAASDEWHQTFVPDRNGNVTDVLIDSLGVLTATMFLVVKSRTRAAA
ncbi:VanZ family protein [Blastopirellula marina]|uniref:VanZ-like domain-containing protein n=1 Tax=Blastopirellula marina TaxID=124 RepID=A0A2S8GEC8_9BACT|nr:VanZ family protein [Blastopirellula marina]PQO42601.1 hypothetical protein C5Y98_01825 [Blastopirellula marina]PTL46367.1 VanZ family protein [Blastopirellula marina]